MRVGFTAEELVKGFTLNDRYIKVYGYFKNILSWFENIRIPSSLVYNSYEFGQKYLY